MLTTDERQLVADAFIAAVKGLLPVLIQVGHLAIDDACDLSGLLTGNSKQSVQGLAVFTLKPEN